MDIKELVEKLGLDVLCGENLEREITGCYCGDLLSWVMSRAQEGDVWLTVMGNINSIGVAVLADVACIVLTENAALDNDALSRAKQNDVVILRTDKNSYQMAAAISKLI
ncbi:MAG: DRTGG domain-containing protein [Acutalibacteraceae bacterium]|nr:DRTGG domain-containing protein [Acutalibacteraceae bacterium]